VIRYIENQEQHHAKKSFRDEYLEFLQKFNVPYDERYFLKPRYDISSNMPPLRGSNFLLPIHSTNMTLLRS